MVQTAGPLQRVRQFIVSPWGLLAQFCLAAVVIIAHAPMPGLFLFAGIMLTLLVVCDDVLAVLPSALLTSLCMIKVDNTTAYGKYSRLWWLIFFVAAAIAFHLWKYQRGKKFVWGKAAWALVGVTVAITIGGLGFISAKEYFAGGALFHVGTLGAGMLVAYLFLSSAVKPDSTGRLPAYIANVMLMMGLFAAFMVFHHYLLHLPAVLAKKELLAFQWRNNVSTFLMFALPFPFYKAFRKPAYLLTALLMYLAILLTGSRGGLLFGSIELFMCILFVLLADKNRRRFYSILFGALAVLVIIAVPLFFGFFKPVLERLVDSLRFGNQEARVGLYRRAIEDFLAHPILGTGLGYMGNRDIHPSKEFALCWYHCAPLQIIGSMGVVGILAYAYNYFVRVKIFLRRRSLFHLTLFLSWLGLEMMSLVNPGEFAPIPYLLLSTMFLVFAEKTVLPAKEEPCTK